VKTKICIIVVLIACAGAVAPIKAQRMVIDSIRLQGNNKTQGEIIFAELSFATGDSLTSTMLDREIIVSENKLRLLGLFNFVNITYKASDSEHVSVLVDLVERWYVWVYPILEIGDINLDTYILNQEYTRINYGISFERHNLFGKNQLIKAKLRLGFKEQYSVYYSNPVCQGNKNLGYFAGVDFFRMKEAVVATENFKPVYYKSPGQNQYIFHYLNASAGMGLKLAGSTNLKVKLAYHYYFCDIDYPDFGSNNFRFPEASLKIESDHRDNKYFPSSGYFMSFEISKYGFFKYPDINSTDLLIFDLKFDAHVRLAKNILAGTQTHWVYQNSGTEHTNFWLYRSIGYENYLRGADNMIINSALYAYAKNSIRFTLFHRDRSEMHLTGLRQFDLFHLSLYAGAFADIAIAKPYGLIVGTGAGFDLVTYYDRVLSLYYAYNNVTKNFNIFVQFKSPIIKQY